MEDPSSTIHDRPYRYLLDSDSEDELEVPESGPSSSRLSKIKITQAEVSLTGAEGSYEEVIIGVGQAGKYLLRKLGVEGRVEAKLGEEVVGSGGAIGGRLVLSVDEDVGDLHALAKGLLSKVKTKSWLVVSTYLPSLYIPDKPFLLPSAPIRALSIQNGSRKEQNLSKVEAITSPNYVTGLAAAIMSNLIHPATAPVSASLILLPLPLSSISKSELLGALSELSQSTDSSELQLSTKANSWSEADDEPYAQAGMGLGKNKPRKRTDVKREVDSMYM